MSPQIKPLDDTQWLIKHNGIEYQGAAWALQIIVKDWETKHGKPSPGGIELEVFELKDGKPSKLTKEGVGEVYDTLCYLVANNELNDAYRNPAPKPVTS